MSGRRASYRYGVTNAEGTLRLLWDVTVQRGVADEFVAISGEPAAFGELFTLERIVNGIPVSSQVCVIESRPSLVSGSVRHRLRLKPIDEIDSEDELHRSAKARAGNR
jgi:hypothetical protein